MSALTFTVVIPAFNAASTIRFALLSILNQSRQPERVIVVDDSSTDDTVAVVDEFIHENKLAHWTCIRQARNLGAGVARDVGVRLADTSYVAFLDADDEWLPQKLHHAESLLKKYKSNLLGAQFFSGDGHDKEMSNEVMDVSLKRLLFKNVFYTSTVVVDRECYLLVGGFDLKQRYSEDFRLWLSVCALSGSRCIVSNDAHAKYAPRMGVNTVRLSSQHWAMEAAELGNFHVLFKKHDIGVFLFVLASLVSLFKYGLRLVK